VRAGSWLGFIRFVNSREQELAVDLTEGEFEKSAIGINCNILMASPNLFFDLLKHGDNGRRRKQARRKKIRT